MTVSFTRAVRDQTSLLIGIAGASGSGKTFSALRLATGLAGPGGRIAFIDTEAGRGLHYADRFSFDHGELREPFTPEAYLEAIVAARDAGYDVIVVDSMSHEYAGPGGLQEIQAAELERMAKGDSYKIEKLSAPAWKEPKKRHKKMIARLMQVRAHLLFCCRAEEKIKFVKVKDERDGKEKTAIVPAGWVPIVEKTFMFEMTVSVTLSPEAPGVPLVDAHGQPIHGKVQEQHRHAFPAGQPISEASGEALATWARGGAAKPQQAGADMQRTEPAQGVDRDAILETARGKARQGRQTLIDWYGGLGSEARDLVEAHTDELKGLYPKEQADAPA